MMKRFKFGIRALGLVLVLAFALLAAFQPAPAARNGFGFGPQLYKSGYTYGNGVYFAPYRFTIYSKPDEQSPAIGEIRWSRETSGNHVTLRTPDGDRRSVKADHLFFCFYPELDVAMLAVTGDHEGGWIEIVYDQARDQTGWIRIPKDSEKTADMPSHMGVYQTWLEFMKLNAKASGVYWLTGVSEYHRSIRFSDADDAKLIPVTIIRSLKVRHIRGNWMLVEVLDFERNSPIGWVRWRDDEGNLMVFPNISGERLPIVTTGF